MISWFADGKVVFDYTTSTPFKDEEVCNAVSGSIRIAEK